MADYNIDDTVDITDVVCPTTFVKAKVALEELDEGQVLSIRMNDGEPVQNCSAQHQGGGSQDPQAHQQQRRYLRPHR